jgi:hypothetical protein
MSALCGDRTRAADSLAKGIATDLRYLAASASARYRGSRAVNCGYLFTTMLGLGSACEATLSTWPGDANQVASRIAEVSDSDLSAFVALRRKNSCSSERLGAGQRLGNVDYSRIEHGVAVVSGPSTNATCGWRRLLVRCDEGVFGRRGPALCDGGSWRSVPRRGGGNPRAPRHDAGRSGSMGIRLPATDIDAA